MTAIAVLLSIICIVGTLLAIIYIYFTWPSRVGRLKTAAAEGLITAVGGAIASAIVVPISPIPPNDMIAMLIFFATFASVLGLFIFIVTYVYLTLQGFRNRPR